MDEVDIQIEWFNARLQDEFPLEVFQMWRPTM